MDSNQVHYEGGDVLVKPSWESPSFFLVHREVLSDRSPYFQAMLADRWSKPRILDSDKEGAPLWTLYIATNTQDPENEPFILTTKVRLSPTKPLMASPSVLMLTCIGLL